MKDRSVEYPNRYRLQKVDGTDDIYDLVPAPGEVTDEGTFINKATLLKDATAALYGLGGDAVPDDVLALLESLVSTAQSAADAAQSTANTAVSNAATAQSTANARARIQYGSYVGFGSNSTYGEDYAVNLTFSFTPKIVFVSRAAQVYDYYGYYIVAIYGQTNSLSIRSAGSGAASYFSVVLNWSGTRLSFYGTNANAINNYLNTSGTTYYYIAIG